MSGNTMDCLRGWYWIEAAQFVAEFTKELYRLLRINLAATTGYHPQEYGQMEWVNQELEQYLQLFINQRQDDWDDLLPLTEFQYNNHVVRGLSV